MVEEGEKYLGSIVQHMEEPLFAISIVAFLVSIIGAILGQTVLNIIAIVMFLLGMVSIYFIYLYFKAGKKNYSFFGIPILILTTTISFWYAAQKSGFTLRDLNVTAIIFGTFLLFYAISIHKILKLRIAIVFAIFLSGLILHLAPASTVQGVNWSGMYLTALDPYFYYRHANFIVENGYVPKHETLVYPNDPPDFSNSRFMVSVLMGSIGTVLKNFGFTTYDIAMIYPGVFAAFSILIIYLLIRDLFADMRPYNYAAGILAAFILMLNPAFAVKAIATNCEDDALGMFLLISSFLLFAISFRRKSYIFSLLAGFSFLMLKLSWGGHIYAITVFGVFAFFYAFVNFIHNKNCTEHIPFFIIPVLISFLDPLILHPEGALPVFRMPSGLLLISISAPIFISFFLEMIRAYRAGRIEIKGDRIEDKVENLIQKNIFQISAAVIVIGLLFSVSVMNPVDMFNFMTENIKGAKVSEIIGMTTAEQAALCSNFNIFDPGTYAGCINRLIDVFGIASLFGLGMVPALLYFAVKKRSLGSVFVLSWSLPMIWGVIHKSQYQFTASVPIVALGSTIGLLVIMKKKDLEGLKVIPTIVLLAVPIFFYFLQGGVPIFGPFGGTAVMYRGMPGDIVYWDPTLQWLKTQPPDSVILTWWDYGHWIAAISNRTSIADNTKARRFIVQDLAKFHVLIENETEALEIARRYNATHVMIDFTMIGKSGAPHFIATSGLGGYIPLKGIGAKVECSNGKNCDYLIDDVEEGYASTYINGNQSGSMVIDFGSRYVINRTDIRLGDIDGGYYQYIVEVSTDGVEWQEVIDKTKGEWRGLQTDYFSDVNARFVKITGTYASVGNEFRVASVRIYNPRIEGEHMGYGQCRFSPSHSRIEPEYVSDGEGGFDKKRTIVFTCTIGGHYSEYVGTVIFEVINDVKFEVKVNPIVTQRGQLTLGKAISWSTWRQEHKASILGIQSPMTLLGNAIAYKENPDNYVSFSTFTTLVYVPEKFNRYMMTSLYLGDYMDEYKQLELCDPSVQKLEHFELMDGFRGSPEEFFSGEDISYLGYVRTYKINYPEEENKTIT